jgi:predicted nucleic acid-binding protein
MKQGELLFVDSGGWIALAVEQDGLHARAVEAWERALSLSAHLITSVPVIMETFTFLERNASREAALAWRASLEALPRLEILECRLADLKSAWTFFKRRDLPKLSAVDATSFVLMKSRKIRYALTFDVHFATAGFLLPG